MQVLLVEYDRLKELEQLRMGSYERSNQFYLTTMTAAAGAFLLLLETQGSLSSLRMSLTSLLGAVLLVGEFTYLKMIGMDVILAQIAAAYQLIRDEFIELDATLANAFPKGLIHDAKRYDSWSSVRGIIIRAFTVSGEKTTVVLLNCLVSAGLTITLVCPTTIWIAFGVGAGTAVLIAFLHAVHASWRYKRMSKQLSGPTRARWWI